MILRLLHSRQLVASFLAASTGMALFFRYPFPEQNLFLRLMAIRSPVAFGFLKYSYTAFLYTTPFIAFSVIFSGLYIFGLKAQANIRSGKLEPYPDPKERAELSLVLGEVHHPRKPVPSENPYWLIIPERGLFTGIAIVGAVGSGKPRQLCIPLQTRFWRFEQTTRLAASAVLILEIKGDFCGKVREILARHGRGEDYIEISLESEYRYNPLHNDLDAYALAYGIASLLNNLFGAEVKETFLGSRLYTNLVKFIILLPYRSLLTTSRSSMSMNAPSTPRR